MKTLADLLHSAANEAPKQGIVYVNADGTETMQTYPELLAKAERIVGGLRARGWKKGTPIPLLVTSPRDFYPAFWACQLGGFVPAPLAPEDDRKFQAVWNSLDRPNSVSDPTVAELAEYERDPNVTPSNLALIPE